MTKDMYSTVDGLEDFLGLMISCATRAMTYGRLRSISYKHILFASDALGLNIPKEIREVQVSDLSRAKRCNIRAPPEVRKASPMSTEIGEACFARMAKASAQKCHDGLRITSKARRILQAIAEHWIMAKYRQSSDMNVKPSSEPWAPAGGQRGVVLALCGSLGIDEPKARSLLAVFDRLAGSMLVLLDMTVNKTIDERLVKASLGSTVVADEEPDAALVRITDRMLRGLAPSMRITKTASIYVAKVLRSLSSDSSTCVTATSAAHAPA